MDKTTKTILWVVIILIIIGGIWWGTSKKPVLTEKEPIKIGAIMMLSGKHARYGEEAQKGFILALEDIQKEMPKVKIELLYEDSKYDPKEGVLTYHRLRDINNISITITLSSPVSLAISPLANQDKVLQMAIVASTPEYTSEGDFTFRTSARADVEDTELAKAVVPRYKNIALLYNNNERGIGHRDAIKPEIESLGGEIVAEEVIDPEATDFRTQLTKIKGKNPEAIYLLTEYKNAGLILKQAKELGIVVQWFATRSIQKEEVLEIAGDAAEGVIYTYGFDPELDKSAIKNFVENYRTKYGGIPDYIAAEAYDGLKLIAKSLNKCGIDAECMKNDLLNTKNYPGVLGSLTFDENGDVYYPYVLKTIKSGQFVPYEE